jgi:methyladenine glycosylase
MTVKARAMPPQATEPGFGAEPRLVPVQDDRTHFEFLVLEGAQAGLSWSIVLNDHLVDCFRYREIRRLASVVDRAAFRRPSRGASR